MKESVTKTGAKMNPNIRAKIVELLTSPDNDGATQAVIAEQAGICERTLRNYLTADLWEEVRRLRLEVMYRSLAMVDRAIFSKAVSGDISAAKLIYSRWDAVKEALPPSEDMTTIAEIDQAIESLQERIRHFEQSTHHEVAAASTASQKTESA